MNTPTIPKPDQRRLQAHYGFARLPFRKNMHAADMFDSRSQRELLHGLGYWLELHGMALVTGPVGVGKSITLRRFVQSLEEQRHRVIHLAMVPTTPVGFLRALNAALGLPMRAHVADLFLQAQRHLVADGPHPVLILDDAEGIRPELLDLLRRLTAHALDADDRFSVLISGTEAILPHLRTSALESLRSRLSFVHSLRPFNLEDARNYVTFHLQRAQAPKDLFTDDAVRRLFTHSGGRPRSVNQLALHALVTAAVQGRDKVDGDFMTQAIADHPLYENLGAA